MGLKHVLLLFGIVGQRHAVPSTAAPIHTAAAAAAASAAISAVGLRAGHAGERRVAKGFFQQQQDVVVFTTHDYSRAAGIVRYQNGGAAETQRVEITTKRIRHLACCLLPNFYEECFTVVDYLKETVDLQALI